MKTSIAAFVVAVEEFLASPPQPGAVDRAADHQRRGRPGGRRHGRGLRAAARARRAARLLHRRRADLGRAPGRHDQERPARQHVRQLTVKGVQGHIAYPQLAKNPIHQALPALAELARDRMGPGQRVLSGRPAGRSATSTRGTGATNVIPGAVVIDFNFRFSTESHAGRPAAAHARGAATGTASTTNWTGSWAACRSSPRPASWSARCRARSAPRPASTTELSTTGGTCDGRFISRICPQVIEFGPVNASIHKIDEHVRGGRHRAAEEHLPAHAGEPRR